MRWPVASLTYGVSGFSIGFLFGALRETILIHFFGETAGHLMESIPLIIAICFAGYWITKRWKITGVIKALHTGILGVVVLLMLENFFPMGF